MADSKVPTDIEKKIRYFMLKCKRFVINEDMNLILIPIDSQEYKEIKAFLNENKRYFNNIFETFENKFDKKEMEQAQAFEMKINNICCGYDNTTSQEYFKTCCREGKLFIQQVKDYEVPPNELRKREVVFSDLYTFIITEKIMLEIKNNSMSNIKFRPVWQRRDIKIPIAYQIEVDELLPSLKELNNWITYACCPNCGKAVYDTNAIGPMYITKDILDNLYDFNATTEQFAELRARRFIVSRRVYDLFRSLGIKNLDFEPVILKE
ncbi:hypothetical protein acsn021_11620 [Anaerocolumna cellulosilytica]|uniref:Uncharacterized protein n=2 Tax=Anaerocolumna cellulosilytica TaxID=433286 RepID=A0A6S6QQI6_9FIRM|nr:hypothetical protein acsn021_11620 [Anaerocolumna cellulosilytica]